MGKVMKIENISDKKIILRDLEGSQCENCALSNICNTESKYLVIEKSSEEYKSGDIVEVDLSNFSFTKVAFIIYGIPLSVFMVVSIIAYYITKKDIISFLSGIIALAVVYLIISFLDKKVFQKKVKPIIKRKIIM